MPKVFRIQEKIAPAVRGNLVTRAKAHTYGKLETHLENACVFQTYAKRRRVGTVGKTPGTSPDVLGLPLPKRVSEIGTGQRKVHVLNQLARCSGYQTPVPTRVERDPEIPFCGKSCMEGIIANYSRSIMVRR